MSLCAIIQDRISSTQSSTFPTVRVVSRIWSDAFLALDRKEAIFLVLLDLSLAFDTIDHALLLETLETRFGISGQALSWFHSYLTDHFQTVHIDTSFSHKQKLDCGIPQGSVLGPQLFTLYSSPVAYIVHQHNLGVQLYADDSQLDLAFFSLNVYKGNSTKKLAWTSHNQIFKPVMLTLVHCMTNELMERKGEDSNY